MRPRERELKRMRNMTNQLLTKVHIRLVFGLVVGLMAAVFMNPSRAYANHVAPPPNMPATEANYLRTVCGHSGQSPAYTSWISPVGAPTATSVTVPYGATSVNLDYNYVGEICYPNNAVPENREHITQVTAQVPGDTVPSGTVTGINNTTATLNWGGSWKTVGAYRTSQRGFTYSPPGGFTKSGTYTIWVERAAINRFVPGNSYLCTGGPGGNRGGWNFGGCFYGKPGKPIFITVTAPPIDQGSCSTTINEGSSLEPGQQFTVNYTVTNGNPTGGYTWAIHPSLGDNRYRLVRQGGSTWPSAPAEIEFAGPGINPVFGGVLQAGVSTSWSQTFTAPNVTGQYQASWQIYGYQDALGKHYVNPPCPPMAFSVANKPYFQAYGGDVSVGAGFGESCGKVPGATIIGFGRITGSGYAGASSQLAVFALDQITEFASGQDRDVSNPKNLTFANDGSGAPNSTYGGGLDPSNIACIPDYWAGATGILSGNQNITGRTVSLGAKPTIYVDGNARITGSILYAGGTYTDINQIPSFRLIVKGNIYVAPSVTELNGLFVAMPRLDGGGNPIPNTGRFYTCSNSTGTGPPATSGEIDDCATSNLTIYGSVVADTIKLARTYGSLKDATTSDVYNTANPAEKFIYTPEVWLTSDFSQDGGVQAYRVLPPVL